MSSGLAVLAYGSAFTLAALSLYFFHSRWYWHAASLVLAVTIGLTPFPPAWQSPAFDLLVGCVFVFLFFWGIGEPLFHGHHHHARHA